MYEDWVIVTYGNTKELFLCKAPKWCGLEEGDVVKVEGWRDYGNVHGCITIDTERDGKLMDFIAFLADQYPSLKITARLSEREMKYE